MRLPRLRGRARRIRRSLLPRRILFIVFDLEAAFLFPWAVSLEFTHWTGWIAMMVFLLELGLGLAYAWKKGALEWE